MVRTRKQCENDPSAAAEVRTPLRQSAPLAPPLQDTSNFQPPSTSVAPSSNRSSSSRTTAKRLAFEAEHARRMVDLEKAAAERMVELEKAAAELELQAKIAELEEGGRSRSVSHVSHRSSNAAVKKWLEQTNTNVPTQDPYINSVAGPSGTCTLGHSAPVTFAPVAVTEAPLRAPSPGVPYRHSHLNPHAAPSCTPRIGGPREEPRSDLADLTRAIVNLSGKAKVPQFTQLPIFDGRFPSDWLIFHKIYDATKSSFSATENMTRLSSALRGSAREAVAILLVAAKDPEQVIQALNLRFGRTELIVLAEIAKVRLLSKLGSAELSHELVEFASRVRNCVETIKLLNHQEYLASPELTNAIVGKLTPSLRAQWAHFAYEKTSTTYFYKLEMLSQFLDFEAEVRQCFGFIPDTDVSAVAVKPKEFVRTHAIDSSINPTPSISSPLSPSKKNLVTSSENSSKQCRFCLGSLHLIDDCSKFRFLSIDARWRWVKEKKVCVRCLKKGNHRYRFCKPNNICSVEGCSRRHHRLLHREYTSTNAVMEAESEPNVSECANLTAPPTCHEGAPLEKEMVSHTISSSPGTRFSLLRPLLKVVPVTVSGPKGKVDTYALLDDGSTGTFIDSTIAKDIGAHGPQNSLRMDCIGGLSKNTVVEFVDFNIKGKYSNEIYRVKNARSISDLNLNRSRPVSIKEIKSYPHLADLSDSISCDRAIPMLLIGIDNWHLIISKETRQGTRSQPVACRTALGWVLFGFSSSRTNPIDFVNHCSTLEMSKEKDDIISLIENYYKLDSIGISKITPLSSDDERAVQIIENTTHRLPDGRFEVGLPWRADNMSVPQGSFHLALSRLKGLERKFVKDPKYAKHYRDNVLATIQKGYVESCSIDTNPSSVTWYLPHFGVTNPNKPGKLRVVHDAAAKCEGVSLNSMLLTGPDLLQSIFDMLLRFREGKVALSADIREMFPQTKIRIEDRDAQRFLWRATPDSPITPFRMKSMIFGAASSPFTAQYLKNKNALEFEITFPTAVKAILKNHYMDDYLGSLDSVEEAAEIARDIVFVHAQARLEMRSWVSNESAALNLISPDLRHTQTTEVSLGAFPETVRTLGLIWEPSSDRIGFNISSSHCTPEKITKRTVLSQVMRVFDPLGLLSPLTIRGRMLFQDAWRSDLDWDQELPPEHRIKWKQWFTDVSQVLKLKIPRWYLNSSSPVRRELHIFCDASQHAYAAVAYWRFVFSDESVSLSLICSKARVAPIKLVSIPRLELQAALVASRLARTICQAIDKKPTERFFWCDSKNVLCWLRNDARTFKSFVAHRIGEIAEITSVNEWRWVPTILNVADDSTRSRSGPLSINDRWFRGPDFLLFSSCDWPQEDKNSGHQISEVVKKDFFVEINLIETAARNAVPLVADCNRFSSWLRFLRATALAHKFIRNLRLRVLKSKGVDICKIFWTKNCIISYSYLEAGSPVASPTILVAEDLELARLHIYRSCQINCFNEELKHIRCKDPLPRDSKLRRLAIFWDEVDGLLRLAGRIDEAKDIGDVSKTPILLDGKYPSVRLLISNFHCKAAHANNEIVYNEIKQQYFIIRLRSVIKKIARSCLFCKIRKANPITPPIGNLPECRLAHHLRPFTFTGLDYFGPIIVTVGRRNEKRYVALFTCLTTRALHLEIVHSLTADSAVMAIRRFIARRGSPSEIWSDNGTAFVGATKEFKVLYATSVLEKAANAEIKWRFIPPGSPFMGGAWERLVRSVKTALKVTLKEKRPKDELLATLLMETEALVNSRPLTYLPADATEEALTPNHFLLGSSSGSPSGGSFSDQDLVGRSEWKKAIRLSDHFWHRWIQEYLPCLIPKQPSSGYAFQNLQVGDVVIVVDPNLPRGIWPKGIIVKIFPGKDGLVRVAEVKTAAGLLKRPARKLARLPV